MSRSHFKGRFSCRYRDKYHGNADRIIWRSSWERLFMMYCDKHPHVLEWSSEEIIIPYLYNREERSYYPDFWIRMIDSTGRIVEKIIEIKPAYQKSWQQNRAKWVEARRYCDKHGFDFVVLTEKELF